MKRMKNRDSMMTIRTPSKVRFGTDLLRRKYAASYTTVIEKALDLLFAQEGLTIKGNGEFTTLLDRLWSEDADERALAISKYAPELLTAEERQQVKAMKSVAA